jgi:hypothetical protein
MELHGSSNRTIPHFLTLEKKPPRLLSSSLDYET